MHTSGCGKVRAHNVQSCRRQTGRNGTKFLRPSVEVLQSRTITQYRAQTHPRDPGARELQFGCLVAVLRPRSSRIRHRSVSEQPLCSPALPQRRTSLGGLLHTSKHAVTVRQKSSGDIISFLYFCMLPARGRVQTSCSHSKVDIWAPESTWSLKIMRPLACAAQLNW